MQETELIGRTIILEVSGFGGTFEPLNSLAVAFAEAHIADQTGTAEAGHGTRVVLGGGLAVELHGFRGVFAGAPAELVAEGGAVAGFCMAVFGGGDEEGEGTVVVFFAFIEESRSIAVGEVVLGEGVAAIGEALKDVAGFAEEFGGGAGGDGVGCAFEVFRCFSAWLSWSAVSVAGGSRFVGCINHKYGKFVLDRRIVRLFDISAIHIQGFPGTKQRGIRPNSFS